MALEYVESERRDVLSDRQAMLEAFDHLGPIEQRIVCRIVERLGMGQGQYGTMREHDRRDFREETAQEVLDGLVYVCRLLHRPDPLQRDTTPCDPVIECNWEE